MIANNLLENEDVLNFFVADKSLISATLNAVNIFQISGSLTVDLEISLLYSKDNRDFKIRFDDVIEYSFYHTSNYYFYSISNLKFLKDENLYYISLDPDEAVGSRSNRDNDYILSRKVQAKIGIRNERTSL